MNGGLHGKNPVKRAMKVGRIQYISSSSIIETVMHDRKQLWPFENFLMSTKNNVIFKSAGIADINV
jgi:hypothetical protein